MNEYKKVRLGDVCEKGSSNIAQNEISENEGNYPIYGAAGFIKNVDFYKQEKPYIGIVKDGAGVGRVSVHPAKSSLIGTMQYILPKENIEIGYLAAYLKSQNLGSLYKGAAIPHIYFKDYENFQIPLPPIETQKQIAATLDKVTKIISENKKLLEKYDLLIKSRFIEMFGDPVANSKSWEVKKLCDWCTKVTDGTHDTPPRYSSGVLLLTGKNIRADHIDFSEVEYVSEEDHKIIYERCNPELGDVLYTNIGVNYGTAVLNTLDYPFSMKNIALLKPKHSLLSGYYLWFVLNLLRTKILDEHKTGGAQTFMSLATIRNLLIPVPPLELQQQFASYVQQIDKSKFVVQKSLEKTETLYKSLMQEYFG